MALLDAFIALNGGYKKSISLSGHQSGTCDLFSDSSIFCPERWCLGGMHFIQKPEMGALSKKTGIHLQKAETVSFPQYCNA
ncbi:MAG: hypothetical protein PHY09_10645 [Desulfuromonadaceae bacterium]|nr:hypothetical protein [Desulfuromonadaceae bacterium]MDD5105222.1 hypothetical protein [Desulfuromonadaceae bacterium]